MAYRSRGFVSDEEIYDEIASYPEQVHSEEGHGLEVQVVLLVIKKCDLMLNTLF